MFGHFDVELTLEAQENEFRRLVEFSFAVAEPSHRVEHVGVERSEAIGAFKKRPRFGKTAILIGPEVTQSVRGLYVVGVDVEKFQKIGFGLLRVARLLRDHGGVVEEVGALSVALVGFVDHPHGVVLAVGFEKEFGFGADERLFVAVRILSGRAQGFDRLVDFPGGRPGARFVEAGLTCEGAGLEFGEGFGRFGGSFQSERRLADLQPHVRVREVDPGTFLAQVLHVAAEVGEGLFGRSRLVGEKARRVEEIGVFDVALRGAVRFLEGGLLLARAGQKEAALKEADRATKGDVENPNLLYTAGLLANEARAPEEALAYFRRYVKYLREESPGIDLSHTDVWLQIGQTALALERPAEAAEAFAELKSGPFARQARLNEARAWAAAGEIDKAIESLRTARQDPHGNEEPLIRAEAELLLEADRKDDAMRVIDEAYERYGKSTDFLYDAAMIAQESGDSKKSETYLLELLDINPDHVQASNALGYLWADQNRRLPEARALLEGAYRLAPLDPYVLDSMGWLCYREGKFDEAAEFILLSLKRQFDVEVAEHLIEVLVAAKRNDEAASLWQDLRKRTNDAPEVLAFGERMGLKR